MNCLYIPNLRSKRNMLCLFIVYVRPNIEVHFLRMTQKKWSKHIRVLVF